MLTVSPADLVDAGDYDAVVALACSGTTAISSTAALAVTPNLSPVSISVSGLTSVSSGLSARG